MNARPPYLRPLPTNINRMVCDVKAATLAMQREAARLLNQRDAALADALAAQADGIRRELLRIASAIRAEGGPRNAA